jgi:major vault protein
MTSGDRSPLRAASVHNLTGGAATYTALAASSIASPEESLHAGISNAPFAGDTFSRGTSYSQPRSITLDTKYDGVVTVSIWPGYAILVTNKAGGRKVEIGPKVVLLEYDEIVQPMELSTGRPKTDTRLLRTAYLRVGNNHVSDKVSVQTEDLVDVELEVSYRVNFEGDDPLKWFDVENYVKVLCDHARSKLRNAAKQVGIQDFYTKTIEIVRDTLLGPSLADGSPRVGLAFQENGMRVYDVEVLNVDIEDAAVANLLVRAQTDALTGAIRVMSAEKATEQTVLLEGYKRQTLAEEEKTSEAIATVKLADLYRTLQQRMAQVAMELNEQEERNKVTEARLAIDRITDEQNTDLQYLRESRRVEIYQAETSEFIRRAEVLTGPLVDALNNFGDKKFVQSMVEAMGPAALALGVTTGDLMGRVFADTPFAGVLETINERPFAHSDGR